jgi:hypothetical protein
LNGSKPLRSIKAGWGAFALALDSFGKLFVANGNPSYGAVAAYEARDLKLERTIWYPQAIAIDSTGRLYVASVPLTQRGRQPGWVSVYAPGGTKPLRKLTQGVDEPWALAIDPSDNLYVANIGARPAGNSVTIYASGGTKPLRTITDGVDGPAALAISSH